MSVFKSYFSKNNTLIEGVLSNNSQNPVTEITYGTVNQQVSRFIFDINFNPLRQRIEEGNINPQNIVKHVLHLTNTIQNAPEYIGKRSYSLDIERASSFNLDLFNVSEDWDEGSGYDFTYGNDVNINLSQNASNWYYRKTNIPWNISGGSYNSGETKIFGTQKFEKGNEDIYIDVTNYINGRLVSEGITGITGYTGTSYGLGIKFSDELENLETLYRQAVGFHTKNTHTFYEPYIETHINDEIKDDRNYFYLNKDNDLYLYSNIGNNTQNITVNKVKIYDNNDVLIDEISGNSINNVKKGVYKITLNIDSDLYPDAVIFMDVWELNINGKIKEYENQFYLISDDNYFNFDLSNRIDFDNYYFYFWGINQKENIVAGDIRKIRLTIKELYPDQNNFIPLDIEYRVFTKVGEKYEIDVIPFTPVDRTNKGYEIDLDTSWLIPQDYCLQLRLKDGNYYENKECVKFTVVSNSIKM
jgi:hypothetical protein